MMVEEMTAGRIVDVNESGVLTIKANAPSLDRALIRKYQDCTIILNDGRHITPEQRRKVYALLGEIDEYVNGMRTAGGTEEQKEFLKIEFMLHRMSDAERKMFSLADCSVTTAREFITFVIDFILANDIPTRFPLMEQCEDIGRYVYACLVNKKCAICGRKCDLHHVDQVGMGNNRNEVHHLGRRALPLCREHHTEIHTIGLKAFTAKYHLEPVEIDKKICKLYHLKE